MFVLYNYYRSDWLPAKIGRMLQESFGSAPIARLYGNAAATLAVGPGIEAVGGQPPGDQVDTLDTAGAPAAATDDWPFLYLIEPYIAPYYIGALVLVLAFAGFMVWRAAKGSGTSLRRFSPHFFLLGVAFLLLETRSLVTFSLLFGSTWIVNSLVFFAVLASVLLAIAINARFKIRNPVPLYVALLVSILVAWLVPPASLLIEPAWLRYLLAGILAFAPVFFANLVFSHSFRDTWTADMAFASNLLGAMVGGALEYIGLLTGYQSLLIVVAGLYVAAWLAATRFRFLADADLVPERATRTRAWRAAHRPRPRRRGGDRVSGSAAAVEALDRRDNAITPMRLLLAGLVLVSHAYVVGGFGLDPMVSATGGQLQLGTAAVLGSSACRATCSRAAGRSCQSSATHGTGPSHRARPVGLRRGGGVRRRPDRDRDGRAADPAQVAAWAIAAMTFQLEAVPIVGLYAGNVLPDWVNGPLWTLPPEVLCYVMLGAIPARMVGAGGPMVLAFAAAANAVTGGQALYMHLPVAFFAGVALYASGTGCRSRRPAWHSPWPRRRSGRSREPSRSSPR